VGGVGVVVGVVVVGLVVGAGVEVVVVVELVVGVGVEVGVIVVPATIVVVMEEQIKGFKGLNIEQFSKRPNLYTLSEVILQESTVQSEQVSGVNVKLLQVPK
jgi:hypothetical protein